MADRGYSRDNNKLPVSVVIPTKNEERNIVGCINSVSWANEIIVFDSYSTDKTTEISRSMGVAVVQRVFDDFASHKNWALNNLDFKNDWILIVDADERVLPGLVEELKHIVESSTECNGYYVARKNMFAGKWMRHGGWYPDWQMRFLRRGCANYEHRIVHEHVLLNGKAGYLKNHLIHSDYKGIERYFERHNTYSSMEAVEAYSTSKKHSAEKTLAGSWTAGGPARRRYLKNLAYQYLPARPLCKFIWMYLFRLGFLDGKIGFRFCLLHAFYEYQISLKLEELQDPDSPLSQKYGKYIA